MELDISNDSLPVYKALASDVRLKIIELLSNESINVKELAIRLGLSTTITLRHLQILADAGIITFKKEGHSKISKVKIDLISIRFPQKIYSPFELHESAIPVGQYTDYSVQPTCGLAGRKDFIGKVDSPSFFMDPDRFKAQMLWFSKGFVEYQAPNFLTNEDNLEMLDLSAELGSEFPFSNNVWPSDITCYINGKELCTWTSPGDFSDIRGKYTPSWVPDNVNQYGILKTFRVTKDGTYLDGQPVSDITLDDINITTPSIKIRFAIKDKAKNQGGCTIYGHGFGNYDQDIKLSLYYS
ncbi:ArsR family transcriptional regulator [Paucilactobacillus oligofermentans DSM 15707 = LMG 22743]|uniref:ArsR family transcriptional regulator n=1 Tax=Paucilactobacillus oligofermentans DSM 15707 = LMG 22743 TaxID=1423778 RepID=A0A0R1REJ5_9LACO|nr:ArsR family transcriptional regulator [Paucilactobacillus oligofermentans]KRL54761.1 ArsR family transcriptional regulator [Paucilactobacillus oligofermentans DSM 15707 = LMG 22743]CUS26324.1 ArsR family transcriptional regulator [Paucilactobacillus oligofermentans DSM 15707 = LMG 22743]